MKAKRVTLQQIAEKTGFSANTVSRALKNQSVISESTRSRIQSAAVEMGYVPNQAATSLRLGQTRTLALIVENLTNPFFGMLFEHIDRAAAALGYTVILFSSHYHGQDEKKAILLALSYGVDGIVLVPSHTSENNLSLLSEKHTPVVLLARAMKQMETDCAVMVDEQAGALAARHLWDAGHRKIIYSGDSGRLYSNNRRLEGFRATLIEAGADLAGQFRMLRGQENADAIAAQIARLIREEGFTAMASFCDMQAHTLIARLRAYGIRVPEDLGCVGFDNIDEFVPSPLPICSVGCDYQAMCDEAVKLLLTRIQGAETPHCVPFSPRLACRDSCRPAVGQRAH